jgi:hypothetical protein
MASMGFESDLSATWNDSSGSVCGAPPIQVTRSASGLAWAASSEALAGSTPVTWWPVAASARVSRPVPTQVSHLG